MMGSAMGKVIRFPIERCRVPHPACEACNKDYDIKEEHRDFIVVSHSCATIPFDERLLWRETKDGKPVDDQGRSDDPVPS